MSGKTYKTDSVSAVCLPRTDHGVSTEGAQFPVTRVRTLHHQVHLIQLVSWPFSPTCRILEMSAWGISGLSWIAVFGLTH